MGQDFAPAGAGQVQEIVQWALAEDQALEIHGSGTKRGFGCSGSAAHGISTGAMCGILAYEPAELVLQAAAGTPLVEIETALNDHGQHLAFEPPSLGSLYGNSGPGTLGGAVMGNLAGPRRLVAGAARDHLLGITAVSGRGEIFKSGGRVIKNVTGYDLSKLLAGSWGTLAVATEFWIKVLPAPAESASLLVAGLPAGEGLSLLRGIAGRMPAITGLAYVPAAGVMADATDFDAAESLALIRIEGSAASVRDNAKAVRTLLPPGNAGVLVTDEKSLSLWKMVRDASVLGNADDTPVVMKVSLPPASAASIVDLLRESGVGNWLADQAGGWLWIGMNGETADKLVPVVRARLDPAGGGAVLYRAPGPLKQRLGVLSLPEGPVPALMRRVKQSFDPSNLLNPGRLFDH